MSKHTPGPWIHDTRGYPHPDVKATSGFNIACTWGVNGQPKTKESYEAQKKIARANARLIAAAPDLLEACQALIAYCDKNPPMGDSLWSVRQIRAAIAKATGGTNV